MRGLFFASSVKYVDAFRIALTQSLILKNIYFELLLSGKPFPHIKVKG